MHYQFNHNGSTEIVLKAETELERLLFKALMDQKSEIIEDKDQSNRGGLLIRKTQASDVSKNNSNNGGTGGASS